MRGGFIFIPFWYDIYNQLMEWALKVDNLVKEFKSIHAVNGISFDIAPGEIFALIGPNGAGKSTTLRIIATIMTPTSGRVEVFGHDIADCAPRVREIISYLPEEAGAYKNLTGSGYLKFMAALSKSDHTERNDSVQFAERITGLGQRLNDKIKTYSKGMVRKLLLARAIMTRPKLAILDEPTSGLDVINAFEIRKIIKQFAAEGMSVLLSSHNMLEIEYLSDRVGIIHQGRILALGKPDELKHEHESQNLEEVFVKLVS